MGIGRGDRRRNWLGMPFHCGILVPFGAVHLLLNRIQAIFPLSWAPNFAPFGHTEVNSGSFAPTGVGIRSSTDDESKSSSVGRKSPLPLETAPAVSAVQKKSLSRKNPPRKIFPGKFSPDTFSGKFLSQKNFPGFFTDKIIQGIFYTTWVPELKETSFCQNQIVFFNILPASRFF